MKLKTVVMTAALVLFTLVACGFNSPARAQDMTPVPASGLIAEWKSEGGGSLTIKQEPCTNAGIEKRVRPGVFPLLRAGTLVYKGRTYQSCWGKWDDRVFSMDETGDTLQPIPWEAFREPTPAGPSV